MKHGRSHCDVEIEGRPLIGVTGIAGIAALIVLSLSGAIVQAQTAAETLSTESHQIPEWQKDDWAVGSITRSNGFGSQMTLCPLIFRREQSFRRPCKNNLD